MSCAHPLELPVVSGAPTCRKGHELTADNLQRIGKAGVRCKICRREIALRSSHRMKGAAR